MNVCPYFLCEREARAEVGEERGGKEGRWEREKGRWLAIGSQVDRVNGHCEDDHCSHDYRDGGENGRENEKRRRRRGGRGEERRRMNDTKREHQSVEG